MTHKEIVDYLIAARVEQGISQVDLAAKAGFSKQVVQQIESTDRSPKLSTILGILETLGHTLIPIRKD
jgi:transcriptional regulator with XRE-family HTH domain